MAVKKEKNKSWLVITGFFILLLGISTITYYFISNKQLDNLEDDALKTFYIEEEKINNEVEQPKEPEKEEVKEHKKIEYIAVLKIPKIN